ncbi:hypothetical protein CBR_g11243 [Chara braunii]|uniref:Uncharacterized protein n=1 Tax=Chara braunii TaxID=69332 RepID=A0A388KQH9_CHABU|nr:hypothetical protein CBR_g11243 [Chara braunii]|eukprot:GBG72314.1 hypothetical protein CBR_g11243 [Chara braunii]
MPANQDKDVGTNEVQEKERQGNRVRKAGRVGGSGQGGEEEIARQEKGLSAEGGGTGCKERTKGRNLERDGLTVDMQVMEEESNEERKSDGREQERNGQTRSPGATSGIGGAGAQRGSRRRRERRGERREERGYRLRTRREEGGEKQIAGGRSGGGWRAQVERWNRAGGREAMEKEDRDKFERN